MAAMAIAVSRRGYEWQVGKDRVERIWRREGLKGSSQILSSKKGAFLRRVLSNDMAAPGLPEDFVSFYLKRRGRLRRTMF
jgi:hypothetical protein